ncbi:MAG: hypothetical protein SGI89_10835 [bacterium]|nr:hypothetical protein [bacterium]
MNTSVYINFGTSIVTFVFGVLLLTGVLYPGNLDSTKLMFGIVLMIYGVYRFITSISKIKQVRMEERRLKLDEEREKFLN